MDNKQILKGNNLVLSYDNREIIHSVDITIPPNKISVIIGSNGCGKSTLLKSFARLLKPKSGTITINDKQLEDFNTKQLAQILGLLPQSPIAPEGISVFDLVSRGRFPYRKFLKGISSQDRKAVENALKIVNIEKLANRNVDELSGGQRQRVWIAMALAQQTDILLLDEPTTYLDISYQIEILDLLTDINRKNKTTIVMVLHDINLSARYADYIFAINKGNLVCHGTPSKVISENLMKQVFNLDCVVIQDPISKTPMIVPKGRHHIKN
ncbi:ABC transporter ATP-binding protein [[Clostridium] colinum]|uniref:ABC transporter ATP-binding protein n=1 Tax=[Clostridium] colinum TaxID=36835 RepID=UPI002025336D|nr:ABC transporter ATP-binding protein [[Clostridium] colinum]